MKRPHATDKQVLVGFLLIIYLLVMLPYAGLIGFSGGHAAKSTSNKVVDSTRTSVSEPLDTTYCSLAYISCGSTMAVQYVPSNVSIDKNKMDVLKSICVKNGLGNQCAKDLYSIAWHESKLDSKALGDWLNGKPRSYGYMQIQVKMHHVSIACAENLYCSAEWTLDKMLKLGYPIYRTRSIKSHNGSGKMADKYARNVIAYANNIR